MMGWREGWEQDRIEGCAFGWGEEDDIVGSRANGDHDADADDLYTLGFAYMEGAPEALQAQASNGSPLDKLIIPEERHPRRW